MNSSLSSGLRLRAVLQLVGHAGAVERGLAPDGVSGRSCRGPCALGVDGLHDLVGLGRVLLEPLGQLLVGGLLHEGLDVGVAELALLLHLYHRRRAAVIRARRQRNRGAGVQVSRVDAFGIRPAYDRVFVVTLRQIACFHVDDSPGDVHIWRRCHTSGGTIPSQSPQLPPPSSPPCLGHTGGRPRND